MLKFLLIWFQDLSIISESSFRPSAHLLSIRPIMLGGRFYLEWGSVKFEIILELKIIFYRPLPKPRSILVWAYSLLIKFRKKNNFFHSKHLGLQIRKCSQKFMKMSMNARKKISVKLIRSKPCQKLYRVNRFEIQNRRTFNIVLTYDWHSLN